MTHEFNLQAIGRQHHARIFIVVFWHHWFASCQSKMVDVVFVLFGFMRYFYDGLVGHGMNNHNFFVVIDSKNYLCNYLFYRI